MGGGGGCDFLIKVGRDVMRVQNLGQTKFPKNLMQGQKSAQKPNDQASFREFQIAKIRHFVKNCQTPNARAKIDP